MEAFEARVDSFKKPKRVRAPSKSSYQNVKWPHPADFFAVPQSLAEAGFYFNPSYDDLDNVTCFTCNKNLAAWEKDDDPFDVHFEKCGKICCWASLRCGLRGDMDESGSKFTFPDKTRLPTSTTMENARLETFRAGDGWVHDKTEDHGARSQNMARAGFVFTPQYPLDDLATCFYCNVALNGWDADDDPTAEHYKREKKTGYKCPFLCLLRDVAEASDMTKRAARMPSSRLGSKSTSKPPSRTLSTATHNDFVMPTKTQDGNNQEDSESSSAAVRKTRRSTAKSKKSLSSKAAKLSGKQVRSSSRNTVQYAADVEEEEKEVIAPSRKPSRSRSAQRKATQELTDDGEASEEAHSRKPSRSKSKPEEPPDQAHIPPRSSRTKARPTTVQEQSEEAPGRKPSRSKAKPALDPQPNAQSGFDERLSVQTSKPARKKTAKTKSRASSRTKPNSPVVLDSDQQRDSTHEREIEYAQATTSLKSTSSLVADNNSDHEGGVDDSAQPSPLSQGQDVDDDPSSSVAETAPSVGPHLGEKPDVKPTAPPASLSRNASRISPPDANAQEQTELAVAPLKSNTGRYEGGSGAAAKPARKSPVKTTKKLIEVSSDEESDLGVEVKASEPARVSSKADTRPPSRTSFGDKPEGPPMESSSTREKTENAKAPMTPPHPPGPGLSSSSSSSAPLPFLTQLPVQPAAPLTEAELDMTVEEYVRHQMKIAYEEYKKAGEWELVQVRKQADCVRGAIEGL